jgi:hypothetical protein
MEIMPLGLIKLFVAVNGLCGEEKMIPLILPLNFAIRVYKTFRTEMKPAPNVDFI